MSRSLEKFLTILFLLASFVITAATSARRTGDTPSSWQGVRPDSSKTNYRVTSDCQGALSDKRVQVIFDEIGLNNYTTEEATATSHLRGFQKHGFASEFLFVGQDDNSQPEGRDCFFEEVRFADYEEYDSAKTEFSFYQPGSLSTLTYGCYLNDRFSCEIELTELATDAVIDDENQ